MTLYKCPRCHAYSETKDDKMAMVICPGGCGEMVIIKECDRNGEKTK